MHPVQSCMCSQMTDGLRAAPTACATASGVRNSVIASPKGATTINFPQKVRKSRRLAPVCSSRCAIVLMRLNVDARLRGKRCEPALGVVRWRTEPVAAEPVEMTEQPENASLRPDVREARLRVEQARLAFRLQAAERIPDIALVVSNTTPVNNDVLPRNMTSAGISMSYEPFTWGRRGRELAGKRLALEQAELALRDTEAAAAVKIAMLRRKVAEGAAQIGVRRMEAMPRTSGSASPP